MTSGTTTVDLNLRAGPGCAALYNGPGQAAKYGSLLPGLFDTFRRLRPA